MSLPIHSLFISVSQAASISGSTSRHRLSFVALYQTFGDLWAFWRNESHQMFSPARKAGTYPAITPHLPEISGALREHIGTLSNRSQCPCYGCCSSTRSSATAVAWSLTNFHCLPRFCHTSMTRVASVYGSWVFWLTPRSNTRAV
jgi:hypothetical protein